MKKETLGFLLLAVLALAIPSCAGTPKSQPYSLSARQGPDTPPFEAAGQESEFGGLETEEPFFDGEYLAEAEAGADVAEAEDIETDEELSLAEAPEEEDAVFESEEAFLAEAEADDDGEGLSEIPAEFPAEDGEQAFLAEAAPPLPPSPEPDLPPVTPPLPRVTLPFFPSIVPQLPPPAAEEPETEAQPPAIARDRLPRIVPELPIPSQGFIGQQDDRIVFSRSVRATVGQLVEVPFWGTGWVYTGETAARRGIAYDSRRLEPEGQTFVFRTESAGVYVLRFYRQDFIRDYIINDHVQVIVGAPPETAGSGWFSPAASQGRVVAEPRWPNSVEEAQRPDTLLQPVPNAGAAPAERTPPPTAPATARPATPPPATQPPATARPVTPPPVAPATAPPAVAQVAPQAVPPTSPQAADEGTATKIPANSPPDEYIKKAREEYEAGRIASAITVLDQFSQRFPSGSDEAFWLYAQCYEANSPSRNILAALDYYRRLVNEYPQSSRANDARRRIAYLERYYINIR
ncbi:MAG: tetratricopeptide repeat protein [Treponema sp.]|jgi:hypothetical protein|nr:tetratricopeptide repeat protein [Treponema sp.]